MMKKHQQLWLESSKFRYLLIGLWNTLAGYSIFALLYLALNERTGYLVIAAISHVFGVSQSFITQRTLVFRSSGNWIKEYGRYHLAHLGSLGFGLLMLPFLVEICQTPPLIAQGMITIIIVISSYFIHRHFTFRHADHA